MITEANGPGSEPVIVDLHPDRPDYRGFMAGPNPASMQADPTFAEIETAGGKVDKNADAHTVLDDMFLVSGMIPRVTAYEKGVLNGIRFESEKGIWVKDEEIADERFLMCNVKGEYIPVWHDLTLRVLTIAREGNSDVYRLQQWWGCACLQERN